MIKKIILIALIVTGLYWYNNFDKPTTLPSYQPPKQALPSVKKETVLKYLPAKHTWPAPLRVMYYMVFTDEIIDPIRSRTDYLPLDFICMDLQHAIIAVEDHDFYQHSAISMEGIIRAFMINTSAGEILQGGSTLTQQLAKNLFLTNEQTINRKVLEAFLALILESKYSKDEILELYLNSTYFGMDCTGINQTSNKLFGKAPMILRLEEAALIAGLPNAPNLLNPYVNPQKAKDRQEVVLNTMQQFGFITQNQCWRAKSATIELNNGERIEHLDKVVL